MKKAYIKNKEKNKGFAIIFSVLIFAAIGVSIATSLLLLGTGFTQSSGSQQDSEGARSLATACAELGLQKLVTLITYTGTTTTAIGTQGNCTYNVSAADATNDYVRASAVSNNAVRKIQVKVSTVTLLISSWQEVGDFS